ncbi:hypothetical protein PISMIDRAFT_11820 [Pisolithus microcarpus 441]|uniref:Yip1 domain-containing protein n=1 Tax=Pisolithus microcarpus 441 TaxID=765257 RepID=A0A0C9YZB0_9AGAM|nr:hypothetical protein BKA83DRAFT_11820 [Pisolithus microcarpus]KIK22096.1 hypothetical protein PISMIDRAFT_11820 [Pisolithus microcarpus 441]
MVPESCPPRENPDVSPVNSSNAQDSVKVQRFRRFMSLVLTGTPSLSKLFDILERPDQTEWRDLKQQLIARTSNVTLVGSLAIAGSISFVTSKSPSPIAAWDNAVPYISLCAGGLCSVLSVVSGLGLVMFLNAVQRQTVRDIQASTFRLIVVAILLAMPFFWLLMGIIVPIMGLVVAVWLGDDTFAKAGATIGITGLIGTLLVIFISLY